jgi:predicted amidohydrolase
MLNNLNIGVIQPDIISNEIDKNLQHCEGLMKSLAGTQNAQGINIFILPEMFATGFPATVEQAEQEAATNQIHLWLKTMAQKLNAVVVGTLGIRESESLNQSEKKHNFYNRLIWQRPSGEHFIYDKKHLFGAEKEIYQSGDKIVTINEYGWNFRLNICYDVRFPVWCKNRVLYGDTLDYDVAIYPASWPTPRINVWKTLLPARAVENLSYTIGVNRTGRDISGTRYNGQSMVSDMLGNIMVHLDEKAQAIKVTIDKEALNKLRRHVTVAHDWDQFEITY